MKNAKNIDVIAGLDQVSNSLVSVHQNTNVAGRRLVTIANFRVRKQNLSPLVNTRNNFVSGLRIIRLDVFKNVAGPAK